MATYSDCRFSLIRTDGQTCCRRYLPTKDHYPSGPQQGQPMAAGNVFPIVPADVWCDEWKQRGKCWVPMLTPDDFPTEEEMDEKARENGQFGVGA